MSVTAVDGTSSVVTASLTNGSSLEAHFSGGTPPVLSSLTPSLSLAAGASLPWTTQALTLNHGTPVSGQSVAWQAGPGIALQGSSPVVTDATGVAAKTLTVGPLAEGQQATANACLNGTSQCVSYRAFGARPEFATLQAVAGIAQSIATTATPGMVTLRVLDMNGNPMAGGTVTLYQTLYAWAPPCPAHGRCPQPQLLGAQTFDCHFGAGRHGELCTGVFARYCHQTCGSGCNWEYQYADDCDRAAPVNERRLA